MPVMGLGISVEQRDLDPERLELLLDRHCRVLVVL
jgi:hypothetical protein